VGDAKLEAFLVKNVIDADTIRDAEGTPKRLLGFDAPETGTPAGDDATEFAKKVIAEHGIEFKDSGRKGYYGRDLASARLADTGTDLAEFLVSQGYARPSFGGEDDQAVMDAESAFNVANVLGHTPDRADERTIDLSSRRATKVMPNPDDVFTNSLARGIDNLQNLGYSASNIGAMALGDLFGTEVMDEWGMEGLKRNVLEAAVNPATIEKWDDVDGLADTYTYIVEALGEQAPNILSFIGTGGIGGVVKYGAGKAVKAGIAKKLHGLALTQGGLITKAQRAQLAKKMPGKGQFGKGQKAGVAAAAYTMGVGEVGNELREGGIDSPLTALVAAVPFAALDTLAFQSHIGKEVITLSARAFHDPTFEIFSDENLARIKEAGIKAGIVGGVAGGGTTAIQSAYGKLTAPRETVPGDIDPQPTPPEDGAPAPPPGEGPPPQPPGPGDAAVDEIAAEITALRQSHADISATVAEQNDRPTKRQSTALATITGKIKKQKEKLKALGLTEKDVADKVKVVQHREAGEHAQQAFEDLRDRVNGDTKEYGKSGSITWAYTADGTRRGKIDKKNIGEIRYVQSRNPRGGNVIYDLVTKEVIAGPQKQGFDGLKDILGTMESDLAPPVDERPQPPPAPAPEITEFEQIEADAGHAPQLAEVEPAMLATEAKINAYEALRMCLAR